MLKNLDAKQKKMLMIAVAVIVTILVIYFVGKKAGSRGKAKRIPLPKDYPGGDIASPTDNSYGGIPGSTIRRISTALYEDMDGFNLTGHNMTPYKEWVQLSDTGFVAVYNDFNEQYYGMDKGTLRQWIVDEMYRDSIVDDVILPRMAKLNLL